MHSGVQGVSEILGQILTVSSSHQNEEKSSCKYICRNEGF